MADTLLEPLAAAPAFKALPLSQRPCTTVAQLPHINGAVHCYRKQAPSPQQGNSAIELVLQCAEDSQPLASILELM
jgi:hypothetical protein